MAGIQLTQTGGAGVINAAGAQNPAPFNSVITGVACALAVVGAAPTSYNWTIAAPSGSRAELKPGFNVAAPTFVPDRAGLWAIELVDENGTVYTLQLLVQSVVTTQRGQAFTPAYVASSQVETPLHGESLFCDNTKDGALSTKDSTGQVLTLRGGAPAIMRQLDWFIDPINGSDSNVGDSAGAPLRTDEQRQLRMGESPVWSEGAYHLRYLNDMTRVVLRGRRLPGSIIFVHGSATDGAGQSVLYSGTIDALTARSYAANQPWDVTSSDLPTSWTTSSLVNERMRLTSGTAMGAKSWALKDLGSKKARFAEFNSAGVFVYPFTSTGGTDVSPSSGDSFVIERLTKIPELFINVGTGFDNSNIPGCVVFESLDVGETAMCGAPTDRVSFVGCKLRFPNTLGSLFQSMNFSACMFYGASGTLLFPNCLAVNINGCCMGGGAGAFNMRVLQTATSFRLMVQGARAVFVAEAGNDLSGWQLGQLGVFDSDLGIVCKSPQGIMLRDASANTVLWGTGLSIASLDIRPGCSVLYHDGGLTRATNFPIASSGNDIRIGGRLAVPAFDRTTKTYTADRTVSFDNLLATVAAGGFCPNVAGAPELVDPNTGTAFLPVVAA